MAFTYDTVQSIINRVAVELGVDPATDVLSSTDQTFTQLQYLLDAAGQELTLLHQWTQLQKEHSIVTDAADSGIYDLPDDFAYMIPQAGWERSNNVPLQGPLSPQDWQYLKGRDLVSQTIYATFRLQQGKFYIFPNDPVADALSIFFEYISSRWVQDSTELTTYRTTVSKNTDYVLFPGILVIKFLKVKFLESKGFESSKARDDFAQIFEASTGQDGSAPILNVGSRRGFPYLDIYRNTPDTNYGT